MDVIGFALHMPTFIYNYFCYKMYNIVAEHFVLLYCQEASAENSSHTCRFQRYIPQLELPQISMMKATGACESGDE